MRSTLQPLVPPPRTGRTFRSVRRIRLSDRNASGRLRLDSVARYLQDVAIDDVAETGWGAPEHVWVVRHMRMDVRVPVLEDERVEVVTWCSGVAPVAAGRRLSLVGDRGGSVEVDSVWAHLGPDMRPARIGPFGPYAEAAGDRVVSPRLELPHPPEDGDRLRWPLRTTDLDVFGHVNNAAYWQAIEHCLPESGIDERRPLRALLGYRHAVDLGEEVELVRFEDGGRFAVAFVVHHVVKAVGELEPA